MGDRTSFPELFDTHLPERQPKEAKKAQKVPIKTMYGLQPGDGNSCGGWSEGLDCGGSRDGKDGVITLHREILLPFWVPMEDSAVFPGTGRSPENDKLSTKGFISSLFTTDKSKADCGP